MLLSRKDLDEIRTAYYAGSFGEVLERSLEGDSVRVSLVRAKHPWPADRVIRVETRSGRVYATQNFESVEEVARRGF